MKRFPLPLCRTVYALRGTLFLAVALVLAQPCTGGPGVFTNTGSLAAERHVHTATLLPNGKVLVAAGENSNGDLASAELYDSASGIWTATGSLVNARHRHTATLLPNGKVLVAAGGGGVGPLAELYDPSSGTWTATGSLTATRNHFTATLLPDGRVLVAGGEAPGGPGPALASAELYDPASGTWTATGSLAVARADPKATLLSNNKVLIVGGRNDGAVALASAELYDPASGTWTATGSLVIARQGHTATLLPSGKVLVAGGSNDGLTAISSAELYDPASGTCTATGSLVIARAEQTATFLPSGKVLVAGGRTSSGNSYLASAELYDPASGTWMATGSLAVARDRHTATLLPNGKVLVAAGENGSGDLASAELYDQGPPFITSPTAASGTVGQPFTYQFTASGATSLAVSNLAPGLTFAPPSLGAITGIPTTAGVFQVGLSATNSQGTTPAALTITVQAAPSGLAIVSTNCATGRTGRPFSFQLQTKGGSSATRFFVENNLPPGFNLDTSTGFISGTPAVDDSFSLVVSAISGTATTRGTLQLTFTSDPTVPIITSARTATLTPGQFFTYPITADANGTFGYIGSDGIVHQAPSPSCAGLPPGLCFDGDHTISGIFNPPFGSDRGSPTRPDQTGGIITNVQLFAANPNGASIIALFRLLDATGAQNISTRLAVGTGDNALIGGFIINESFPGSGGPKKVVIRAKGPSLTQVGVPNALADPVLELNAQAGLLSSNDNWRDNQGQATQIIATGLQPSDDREAAILAYLNPGLYTAVVRGKNNSIGNAIVEVYDLGTVLLADASNSRLANISTRGTVLTGDNRMFGGFIIGRADTRVVVRAIGPSLSAFVSGALQDPTLELKNANGVTLIGNDDWESDPMQAAELLQRQLAPTNPRESALVATLAPGNYTAIVSGKGGTTGVALVEGYVLSNP